MQLLPLKVSVTVHLLSASSSPTITDEKEEVLSTQLLALPSKRKLPDYYQKIPDPIDLTTIEQNIATGVYRSADAFEADMNRLFANCIRYHGRTSDPGIAATRLKKVYQDAKAEAVVKYEQIVGEKPPSAFVSSKSKGKMFRFVWNYGMSLVSVGEEEDVIRCICGMYRDEGLMIQCERCLVWQHCECVKADPAAASYHCEHCIPRPVDYEIALNEFTEHGHQYVILIVN